MQQKWYVLNTKHYKYIEGVPVNQQQEVNVFARLRVEPKMPDGLFKYGEQLWWLIE